MKLIKPRAAAKWFEDIDVVARIHQRFGTYGMTVRKRRLAAGEAMLFISSAHSAVLVVEPKPNGELFIELAIAERPGVLQMFEPFLNSLARVLEATRITLRCEGKARQRLFARFGCLPDPTRRNYMTRAVPALELT